MRYPELEKLTEGECFVDLRGRHADVVVTNPHVGVVVEKSGIPLYKFFNVLKLCTLCPECVNGHRADLGELILVVPVIGDDKIPSPR